MLLLPAQRSAHGVENAESDRNPDDGEPESQQLPRQPLNGVHAQILRAETGRDRGSERVHERQLHRAPSGRWLGGHASARDIRAATAWSSVPVVLASVLWILLLLLGGPDLFTSETPRLDANPTPAMLMLLLIALQFVAGIWSMIVLCKCQGQVQGFSAWKGLGNSLLVALVLVVAIVAIAIGVGPLAR